MSDSQPSRVFMFDDADPQMQEAYEKARATFRYFWREITWEYQRIIPALNLACVKAPFFDSDGKKKADGRPDAEQMWFSDIAFDGETVSGILQNRPDWVKSVKEGDQVRKQLGEITDWMYVVDGEVYGAYTVNLMRSRMGRLEREAHDEAWGLTFGDPETIRLVPQEEGWFDEVNAEIQEHPMSESMAPEYEAQLKQDASVLQQTDERGWTLLQWHALAGNAAVVKVFLDAGADANAAMSDGRTPLQLARSMGWETVVALLLSRGAR